MRLRTSNRLWLFTRAPGIALASLAFWIALTGSSAAMCGDLDSNGEVSAADAYLALRSALASDDDCDHCLCDINCDRASTTTDALGILRAAVGLGVIDCCTVEECVSNGDCGAGNACISDPSTSCDTLCVEATTTTTTVTPESTTTTTFVPRPECETNNDCGNAGFPPGSICVANGCVQCSDSSDCEEGSVCSENECVATAAPTIANGAALALEGGTAFLVSAASAQRTGDGEFAVVWTNSEAGDLSGPRILSQRFDPDTGGFLEREDVSGASPTKFLRPLATCADAEGAINVVWEEEINPTAVANGVYTDTSNIYLRRLANDPQASVPKLRANDETFGSQSFPDVACLEDGGLVVAWRSNCTAIERRNRGLTVVVVHYNPNECADKEPDGVYYRHFDANGQPVGPSRRGRAPESSFPGNPSVEALPGGGFVLLEPYFVYSLTDFTWTESGTVATAYTADGMASPVATLPGYPSGFRRRALECVGSRCLAIVSDFGDPVIADVIDVADPSKNDQVLVARGVPYDPDSMVSVYVSTADAACDDKGQCLITWVREELEIDYDVITRWDTTPYVRYFNMNTLELGPAQPLVIATDPVPASGAPFLTAVEDNRFAVFLHDSAPDQVLGRFVELTDNNLRPSQRESERTRILSRERPDGAASSQ